MVDLQQLTHQSYHGNAIGSVSIYDINMNSGYSQVICVMNPNSITR